MTVSGIGCFDGLFELSCNFDGRALNKSRVVFCFRLLLFHLLSTLFHQHGYFATIHGSSSQQSTLPLQPKRQWRSPLFVVCRNRIWGVVGERARELSHATYLSRVSARSALTRTGGRWSVVSLPKQMLSLYSPISLLAWGLVLFLGAGDAT